FRGRHGALARAMALSILLQLNVVAFYWLIGRAMGFPLGLADWLLIVPIATVVMMAPVSINGIGVREGILALLLGAHGVAPADAVAFAWLEYASFLLYGLIGGLVYAARRAGAPPADDLAAQSAARAASGDAAAPPPPATAARASPLPRPARREAIPAASAD